MLGIIYKFTSPSNKVYIGLTTRKYRKCEHSSYANRGNNRPFYKAIRKYGFENFKYEIIYTIESNIPNYVNQVLDLMEEYFILKFKSTDRAFGYNLAKGGRTPRGCKRSDEYKRRLSERQKGKPMPPLCIEHSAAARKGIPRSAETKARISAKQTHKNIGIYKENDVIVQIFKNAYEAAKYFNCSRSNIQRIITNNKTYKGFILKFINI